MPTYEYECVKCKDHFCITISFKEKVINLTCPKCKSKKVRKIWFAPTIIYNGNGFYTRDHPKEK